MNQKHNYDFSQPNKLDRKALWLVLGNALWTIVRSLWPILAVFALRGFKTEAYWIYIGVSAITLLIFARLSINYFYYSYQVAGDELIIYKGWLNKSKTVVKLDKIHEVNLNQKLIHKIIGLYLISVDTAGSSKTEITINGIAYRKALALKEVLTNTEVEAVDGRSEDLMINSTENQSINENIDRKSVV